MIPDLCSFCFPCFRNQDEISETASTLAEDENIHLENIDANGDLAEQSTSHFRHSVQLWGKNAQSPGYLCGITITLVFAKEIESAVRYQVENEGPLADGFFKMFLTEAHENPEILTTDIILQPDDELDEYEFAEETAKIRDWVLNSGDSPFTFCYKVEGRVTQGNPPFPLHHAEIPLFR